MKWENRNNTQIHRREAKRKQEAEQLNWYKSPSNEEQYEDKLDWFKTTINQDKATDEM